MSTEARAAVLVQAVAAHLHDLALGEGGRGVVLAVERHGAERLAAAVAQPVRSSVIWSSVSVQRSPVGLS